MSPFPWCCERRLFVAILCAALHRCSFTATRYRLRYQARIPRPVRRLCRALSVRHMACAWSSMCNCPASSRRPSYIEVQSGPDGCVVVLHERRLRCQRIFGTDASRLHNSTFCWRAQASQTRTRFGRGMLPSVLDSRASTFVTEVQCLASYSSYAAWPLLQSPHVHWRNPLVQVPRPLRMFPPSLRKGWESG